MDNFMFQKLMAREKLEEEKIRKELRNIGISHLKVLYSKEEPVIHSSTPSSISFVPGCAGLILASEVIKDILL